MALKLRNTRKAGPSAPAGKSTAAELSSGAIALPSMRFTPMRTQSLTGRRALRPVMLSSKPAGRRIS